MNTGELRYIIRGEVCRKNSGHKFQQCYDFYFSSFCSASLACETAAAAAAPASSNFLSSLVPGWGILPGYQRPKPGDLRGEVDGDISMGKFNALLSKALLDAAVYLPANHKLISRFGFKFNAQYHLILIPEDEDCDFAAS